MKVKESGVVEYLKYVCGERTRVWSGVTEDFNKDPTEGTWRTGKCERGGTPGRTLQGTPPRSGKVTTTTGDPERGLGRPVQGTRGSCLPIDPGLSVMVGEPLVTETQGATQDNVSCL